MGVSDRTRPGGRGRCCRLVTKTGRARGWPVTAAAFLPPVEDRRGPRPVTVPVPSGPARHVPGWSRHCPGPARPSLSRSHPDPPVTSRGGPVTRVSPVTPGFSLSWSRLRHPAHTHTTPVPAQSPGRARTPVTPVARRHVTPRHGARHAPAPAAAGRWRRGPPSAPDCATPGPAFSASGPPC